MKSHLAKLSLALLSTVFLLGCQEQGSDPVGLEGFAPEFHVGHGECEGHNKKGNPACVSDPRNAVVEVTVASDLLHGMESGRAASLNDGGSSIHNVLLTVVDNLCSVSGDIRGIIDILDAPETQRTATFRFPVPLGSPRWVFAFSGGSVTGGVDWPPLEDGQSTTLTFTSWELKQISPKGKESRVRCPISGSQTTTITVLNTG